MLLLLFLLFLVFGSSYAQNRLDLGVEFINYSKSSPQEVVNLLEDMYQKSLKYHNDMEVLYRMYQNSFTPEEFAHINTELSRLNSGIQRLNDLKNVYTSHGFNNTRQYFDTIYTVRELQMTISNLERYGYPIPELSPQPYTFTSSDVQRVVKVRSFRRLVDFFISRMFTFTFGAFFPDVLLDFAYVQDPNQIIRRLMVVRRAMVYKPVQLPELLFSTYTPIPELMNFPYLDTNPYDCSLRCLYLSECSSYCQSCVPQYTYDDDGNLVYSPLYYTSISRLWRGVAPRCDDYGLQEFSGINGSGGYAHSIYSPPVCNPDYGLWHIEDIHNTVFLRLLNLAIACLGISYCNQYNHTGLSLGWATNFINEAIETYGLDSATAFHIAPLGRLSGDEVPQELYDLNVCSGATFYHPGLYRLPDDLSSIPVGPYGNNTVGLWRRGTNDIHTEEVFQNEVFGYWAPTQCKRFIPFVLVSTDRCSSIGRLCYHKAGLAFPIPLYQMTEQSIVITIPLNCPALVSDLFPDIDEFFPWLERDHIPQTYKDLLRRLRELVRQRQEVKKRYPHALPYLPAPTLNPQIYLSPEFLPLPDVSLRPVSYSTPQGTITIHLDELKPYLDALLREELEHITPYITGVQRDTCRLQEEIMSYNFDELFNAFRYSFIALSLMFGVVSGAIGGFSIYTFIRNLNLWRL